MELWYLGALLSIFGSVASNLGVNIQKYSFMQNSKLALHERKTYIKDPRWLLGLAMIMLGSIGDFAALGLAAQSIVAPIGSTTLVANIFFAHYWLKEKLSRRDLLGTFFILLGSTLAVSFGDHAEREWVISQLLDLYLEPVFILYGCAVIAVGIFLYVSIRRVEPLKVLLVDSISKYESAVALRDFQGANKYDALIAKIELKYSKYEKVHPILYCALSGILGANSILFGKAVAELIATTIRGGGNQMANPLTYLFMALMFSCVFSQIHFLAKALNFFDALYVVPVFQCFLIMVSTFGGAAYFQEFSEFSLLQGFMFPAGILVTLAGVYVLSSRNMGSFLNGKSVLSDSDMDEIEPVDLAEAGLSSSLSKGLEIVGKSLRKQPKRSFNDSGSFTESLLDSSLLEGDEREDGEEQGGRVGDEKALSIHARNQNQVEESDHEKTKERGGGLELDVQRIMNSSRVENRLTFHSGKEPEDDESKEEKFPVSLISSSSISSQSSSSSSPSSFAALAAPIPVSSFSIEGAASSHSHLSSHSHSHSNSNPFFSSRPTRVPHTISPLFGASQASAPPPASVPSFAPAAGFSSIATSSLATSSLTSSPLMSSSSASSSSSSNTNCAPSPAFSPPHGFDVLPFSPVSKSARSFSSRHNKGSVGAHSGPSSGRSSPSQEHSIGPATVAQSAVFTPIFGSMLKPPPVVDIDLI